jgi:integrase
MKTEEKPRVWSTTNVQNLYRHKSGNYYGRFKVCGKNKWVPLRTKRFTTAKLKLADEGKKAAERRAAAIPTDGMSLTFGDLAETYRERFQADPKLTPATRLSREDALNRITKTWPEFMGMKPARLLAPMVVQWSNRLRTGATFSRPGAKTVHQGYAADSVNKSVETVKRLLDIAVETGATLHNVLRMLPPGVKVRHEVRPAKPVLPSTDQMRRLLDELETRADFSPGMPESLVAQLNKDRIDVGEFARFLAYSGARLGEAAAMTWDRVRAKTLIIPGTKTESSRDREVPQIPSMIQLLARIRARRESANEPLSGPVFRVKECQKSINRACQDLNLARLTHHDFRHYFATICIESGVDIPTVARWLGHADGGALAMKTYGHLRQEHSLAQATKVAT